MAVVSENWAELLEPGLRKIFYDTFHDYPSQIPALYNMQTSNKAEEHDLGAGALTDIPEFEGTIEYQQPYKQYQTDYVHTEYAGGIQIERKLLDDDLYNIIKRYPQQLATALARTRETKAADIFNNAFSTASFTGGDSLSLCNSSHTTTSSSDTQDNAGTYSLSADNLETVRLAMRDFTDDRGNVIVVNPDLILIPPDLEETVYEITKTPKGLDTADGNVNFLYGRYKYIVWDYLTDANNWFLIDSTLMKQSLFWFERIPAEFNKTKDFDTIGQATVVYKENYMRETPKDPYTDKVKIKEMMTMGNTQERLSTYWLAGFIDGEGNFSMYKHNQQDVYVPRLIVTNTDKDAIEVVHDILNDNGVGCYVLTSKRRSKKHKPVHRLCVVGMKRMRKLLDLITDKLISKKKQAEIISEFIDYRMSVKRNTPYGDKEASYREALYKEIDSGRNPQRPYVLPN